MTRFRRLVVPLLVAVFAAFAVASAQGGKPAPPAKGPKLTITPASVTLGPVDPGVGASQEFVLGFKDGKTSGELTVAVAGDGFAVTDDACTGTALKPGQTCTITVMYVPGGYGESVEGTLSATGKTDVKSASADLFGSSTVASLVTAEPDQVDFGLMVPNDSPFGENVAFTNTTEHLLHVRDAALSSPFSTYDSSDCSDLPAGGTCTIHYYAYTLTPGTYTTTLVQPFVWVEASGSEHTVSAETVEFTFARTANYRPIADWQAVTTTQNTAKTITLTAHDPEGEAVSFFVVHPESWPEHGDVSAVSNTSCTGAPLTCTAQVTYTPDSGYTGSDWFLFGVNDGELDSGGAYIDITVTAPPAVSASPAELDFGAQAVGTESTAQVITFTNNSQSTVLLDGYTAPAGFSVATTGCGYPGFAPGASCSGTVTFNPTVVGPYSTSLTIRWATLEEVEVARTTTLLKGTGESATLPSLSIDSPYGCANCGSGPFIVTFTVSMSHASGTNVTFDWSATDDSATWGTTCDKWCDYTSTAMTGNGTIPAGSTSTTIVFGLCDDGPGFVYPFPPIKFTVTISNAMGATIASDTGTGELRIS